MHNAFRTDEDRLKSRPLSKNKFRFVDTSDAIVVCILGIALLAGKIRGVVLGPINICVGISTIISAILLLLEDLQVLRGRWAWTGWMLLLVTLVVFGLVNF